MIATCLFGLASPAAIILASTPVRAANRRIPVRMRSNQASPRTLTTVTMRVSDRWAGSPGAYACGDRRADSDHQEEQGDGLEQMHSHRDFGARAGWADRSASAVSYPSASPPRRSSTLLTFSVSV